MLYLLDTANLADIKHANEFYPLHYRKGEDRILVSHKGNSRDHRS